MEKIYGLFLLLFIAFLLTACGKEEVEDIFVNSITLDGLSGDGTLSAPYIIEAEKEELIEVSIIADPVLNNDTFEFFEVIDIAGSFVELSSSEDLDLSSSNSSMLSFTALSVGTFYVKINVGENIEVYVEVFVKTNVEVDFNTTLKVLAVGNSFSVDGMEYLYKVADDFGIEEIVLGILYIPGASLNDHVSSFTTFNDNYTYYKNTDDEWVPNYSEKLYDGLIDEEWDIITIQQVSGSSGLPETYNEDLEDLIEYINNNKTNEDAEIVWHMTWAYQQNASHSSFPNYNSDQVTMYNAITDTVQSEIESRRDIAYVIPSGTTVQNLRTSYMGDHLTVDGYHLSRDIGRLSAALTWFNKITGLSIDDISFKPEGVTDKDLLTIKESVMNSINKPYEVTNSSYTQQDEVIVDPVDPSLGGVPALEYVLGFWNSTSTHSIIDGDPISVNYLASSFRLSKTQLPVGSIITIADGYQYRANFWTNLEGETGGRRTDNITTSSIVIDEAWWGDQEYVAFNISEIGTPDLTDRIEEVSDKFSIEVPLVELDIIFESGFYNSYGSHSLIDGDAISVNYIAPDTRYTRQDIPVGSVITIQSGYQYRANFWMLLDGSLSGNYRTDNITTLTIIVDDSWWGDQQFVAFNISELGTPDISGRIAEVVLMFSIEVPIH